MHTIAFVSQKGGSGKTTLALHVAVEAATRGLKTILVDLDPQASAARWADRRNGQLVDIDVTSEHPARLDVSLSAAAREGYDLAILDTAPHADQAALRAAKAADLILVPCRPSILDLDAIQATLDLCELARRKAVVVLNAAPIRSRVVDEAAEAITSRGGQISTAIVRERVAFRHSLIDGRVAGEYEPDGAAAREISALVDMIALIHVGMFARQSASEKA